MKTAQPEKATSALLEIESGVEVFRSHMTMEKMQEEA